MRTLIVEDNAIQALTLEMILKRLGFTEVEKVYSAEKAYEILESFQPELMLVDINLGSAETGVDVVKKAQKLLPVRVLYITGNSDIHHKKLAEETNFLGYMIKPIDPFKLEKILVEEEIVAT